MITVNVSTEARVENFESMQIYDDRAFVVGIQIWKSHTHTYKSGNPTVRSAGRYWKFDGALRLGCFSLAPVSERY